MEEGRKSTKIGSERTVQPDHEMLLALLGEKLPAYVGTIKITLELWERMMFNQRLPVTGDTKKFLLDEIRAEVLDFEGDGMQNWFVDCQFFPSTTKHPFWINNAGENGEWGLWFDHVTLCELRSLNALLCGIDLTLWVYWENDGRRLHCLAWSEFWSDDHLQDLVALLASSPPPPIPVD